MWFDTLSSPSSSDPRSCALPLLISSSVGPGASEPAVLEAAAGLR